MLYVSSMAGYDQRLLEDGKTNRFLPRENASYCFLSVVFFDSDSDPRLLRAQHSLRRVLFFLFSVQQVKPTHRRRINKKGKDEFSFHVGLAVFCQFEAISVPVAIIRGEAIFCRFVFV